jgi:hypothetical protein
MSFFFKKHPLISYDVQKKNLPNIVQNPLVRFKLLDILKTRTALYYTHNIEEGQTVQFIADRYYNDITLDWVIYIVNNIIDPQYDLPLDYQQFNAFVKGKYGKVETAMNTIHHYEHMYQKQSVIFDGTIVPEKVIIIDATTYASLPATDRREVSSFTYEERLNDSKRTIKILHHDYIDQFLDEAESIFE